MTSSSPQSKGQPDINDAKPTKNPLEKAPALSRKKKILRLGVVGVILLACLFGIPRFIHSLSHESTDDAFIDGTIVRISPRISGHVLKVYASDNRPVKSGELLLELMPDDFESRLNAAEAELKSARAADQKRTIEVDLTRITTTSELNEAENNVDASGATVREASARLAMAKASLEQSGAEAQSASVKHQMDAKDLKRFEEMAGSHMVSPQDLDHAKTAEQISGAALTAVQKRVDIQLAAVQQAEAALKVAEARLHQANARLAVAQAAPQRLRQSQLQAAMSGFDVEKAHANAVQARLNLSYTKITAPCDGFVARKSVEPGQFVQTGQSLMAIVSKKIWVTANFKETQISKMKPGQPVNIRVDTYPDLTLKGHVDSIQRGTGAKFSLLPPENATGNFVKVVQRVPVKIVLDLEKDQTDILLTPGMSVVPDVNISARGSEGNRSEAQPVTTINDDTGNAQ